MRKTIPLTPRDLQGNRTNEYTPRPGGPTYGGEGFMKRPKVEEKRVRKSLIKRFIKFIVG